MDAIEAMAQVIDPEAFGRSPHDLGEYGMSDRDVARMEARLIIAALREPAVLAELCRKAADPKSGDGCWVGVTPQMAAEIVDAVLGAALGEGEHG